MRMPRCLSTVKFIPGGTVVPLSMRRPRSVAEGSVSRQGSRKFSPSLITTRRDVLLVQNTRCGSEMGIKMHVISLNNYCNTIMQQFSADLTHLSHTHAVRRSDY